MKKKTFRISKRLFSLLLSVILSLSLIGCSPDSGQSDVSNAGVQSSPGTGDAVSDADDPVSNTEGSGLITDNGKPIYDFDEYVNSEWRRKYEDGGKTVYIETEMYDLYFERMKDIVQNTDLSSLDNNSGLFKAISLYNEICDTSDNSTRLGSISAFLHSIERIDNLTELYSNEIYLNNDYVFHFYVRPDSGGYNSVYFEPVRLTESVNYAREQMEDPDNEDGEFLRFCFENLGYSDDRVNEFFDNCLKIGTFIDSYREETVSWYDYWDAEKLTDADVSFPVFEIINGLSSFEKVDYFFADEDFAEFVNQVYTDENLDALKDCIIFGLLWLYDYSGADISNSEDKGIEFLLKCTPDVMAMEYMKIYGSADMIKDINSMILDIKQAEISLVSDSEWVEDSTEQIIKQKMSRMTQFIGENGHKFLLGDFALTGDTISDILELQSLYFSFLREEIYYDWGSRAPFGSSISTVNAAYNQCLNSLIVYPAYICDPSYAGVDTYEEKLGVLGVAIAHEIGHSIDRNGIDYDWEGFYDPYLSDKEAEEYNSRLQTISDYLSSCTCEFDMQIPGDTVLNETIADLIAMETCLKVLSKREEVDYDLFFRTYARTKAAYYDEDDYEYYLNEGHLTSKPRINLILAQFDEFYETYDIDESSPYYVPADERLRVF